MFSAGIFRYIGVLALAGSLAACGGGSQAALSTSNPQSTPTDGGSLQLTSTAYSANQADGTVMVSVTRSNSSTGAVSVDYATSDGTAVSGADYTATAGTLSWADGDSSSQTVSIPVSTATAFNGDKTLTFTLSSPSSGATVGTPASATITIQGSGTGSSTSAGTVAFSAATYAVSQSAGTMTINAKRTGGSAGAVSVSYATSNGTATAGTDYTTKSGTLSWADGDATSKNFKVTISNATPFTGARTFTVTLSAPTGGAALGSVKSATATINGSASSGGGSTSGCAKSSNSYTTTGAYDSKQYGNYFVNNNNWGGTPGQQFWSNSADCWGVTTTSTVDTQSIGSYPSVTRGWSQNATAMQDASPSNPNAWTVASGMGIAVTALTTAKIHWAFSPPTNSGVRWLGLQDIYFHKTNNPSPTEFPPFVDLMIDQAIADQVVGDSTFYALAAASDHGTMVTIGGNTYLVFIDDSDEVGYHQNGGHNIHLFNTPTAFELNTALALWGSYNATQDLAAIVQYFMQSNPVDDAGNPLKNSNGAVITSPLIASNLYLTAINSGWEIDTGTVFTNTAFCVQLQNEPACP